jgi:hypothetical protein
MNQQAVQLIHLLQLEISQYDVPGGTIANPSDHSGAQSLCALIALVVAVGGVPSERPPERWCAACARRELAIRSHRCRAPQHWRRVATGQLAKGERR